MLVQGLPVGFKSAGFRLAGRQLTRIVNREIYNAILCFRSSGRILVQQQWECRRFYRL